MPVQGWVDGPAAEAIERDDRGPRCPVHRQRFVFEREFHGPGTAAPSLIIHFGRDGPEVAVVRAAGGAGHLARV